MPTTRSRENTRARLVEAASEVFAEVGFDGASVEAICERAGFTRGAFYSNFDTKNDVCAAVARYIADEYVEACRTALASATKDTDIGELLGRLFSAGAFSPERQRTMVELQLRASREPALSERLALAREETWPLIVEVVDHGAAQANCIFAMDTHDLLRLCEALFFSPLLTADGSNLRLMSRVLEALAVENHPDG